MRVRTPPSLKWALNERAHLQGQADALRRKLADLNALLAETESALASLDVFIRTLAERVPPSALGTVNAQGGRYGAKRGALKSFLVEQLQLAGADGISTAELASTVVERFGIQFDTPAERKAWVDNVLRARLKEMRRVGLLENVGAAEGGGIAGAFGGSVTWRVAQGPGLAELRELRDSMRRG
jgi:hypothetical protein